MILRINVAPDQKIEVNYRELTPAFAIVLLCVVAAYYAPIFYADKISAEAAEIAAKTQEKKSQLAALELDVNKIKAVQSVISELEGRKRVIQSLTETRKQPVAVLETLQEAQLDRMWIETLDYKANLMQLRGWATDHVVISEYVRRLKTTTGTQDENAIDAQNFQPSFENTPAPLEPKVVAVRGDINAVHFTDVMLKESLLKENSDSPTTLPIQTFEVEFNPNIEKSGGR